MFLLNSEQLQYEVTIYTVICTSVVLEHVAIVLQVISSLSCIYLTLALDGCKWSASSPRHAFPQGKDPQYPLSRSLCFLMAGLGTEVGRKIVCCSCWGLNPSCPVYSQTLLILTELPQLLSFNYFFLYICKTLANYRHHFSYMIYLLVMIMKVCTMLLFSQFKKKGHNLTLLSGRVQVNNRRVTHSDNDIDCLSHCCCPSQKCLLSFYLKLKTYQRSCSVKYYSVLYCYICIVKRSHFPQQRIRVIFAALVIPVYNL